MPHSSPAPRCCLTPLVSGHPRRWPTRRLLPTPQPPPPYSTTKMDFVALVSGGKDSWFSAIEAQRFGHRLVALANLLPANDADADVDSWMFQARLRKRERPATGRVLAPSLAPYH